MKTIINKIIAVVTLISTLFFQSPGFALAYYQDTEIGNGYLETGLLDFELSETGGFEELAEYGKTVTTTIDIIDKSTIPFKYRMFVKNISGSNLLVCDYIWFTIKQGDTVLANNISLSTLSAPFDLGVYDKNNAKFTIEGQLSTTDPNFQDQSCSFDIEFEGVQTNHDWKEGYYDIETTSEIVYTGHWKDDLKCDLSVWNPGSIKVVATNSYSADCRVEHVQFDVTCVSGNNVNCGAVGISYSNGMGVNAMHQITPDFPEGMTTMFDASSPFGGGQGVIWLTRPVPATGKTYSVNVQHELANYEASYGAYLTYGDTCEGKSKIERIKMAPSYQACQGGSETTVIEFVQPIPEVQKAEDYIVLNEFLPNPTGIAYGYNWGQDSNSKPKGEWVELYNNSTTTDFDVNNWIIKDRDNNAVVIDANKTKNSETIVPKQGYLVVYLNMSLLNNIGKEDVKLFNDLGTLIDSHTYNGGDYCYLEPTIGETNDEEPTNWLCSIFPTVPDNKSFARIPDGIGAWVDPIPTPGDKNVDEIVIAPISPTNTTSTEGATISIDTSITNTTSSTSTATTTSGLTIDLGNVTTTTSGSATTTFDFSTTSIGLLNTTSTDATSTDATSTEPPQQNPEEPILPPTTLPEPLPEPEPPVIEEPLPEPTPSPVISPIITPTGDAGIVTDTSTGTSLTINP